jgi:hypothetical protein
LYYHSFFLSSFLYFNLLDKKKMSFLTTLHRMAPNAVKRAATISAKPTAVALTQKRFNSNGGAEVK